jgi:3-hydroxyisobutyrate dehydrogenase
MDGVAFIGLGNMGSGMAANLAKAGRKVRAFDLSPAALERAKAAGCAVAASAADSVRGASVVITMLPAAQQVHAVWREAILPNAAPGAMLIDCSTIDVESAKVIGEGALAAGFRVADAPVSGGVAAAEAGTLAFMAGCSEGLFRDLEDTLAPMARTVIHAGELGAGQAAKICNNMLLGVTMIGVAEAFALAERLGLDPQRFYDIASKSSGQCWSLTSYCPWPGPVATAPSNRGYEGGFPTSLMSKDLQLAQQAAAKVGASTPMGAQAQATYALFEALGYGHKDFSALLQLLRGRLGDLSV